MTTTTTAVTPVSVLVVDDDEVACYLINKALVPLGHRVQCAGTGRDALELLEGVDLVLLDYSLPDMNGTEVLAAVKERRGPSVVMVTGTGSESVAVDALRLGAVDYVVKDENYVANLPQVIERARRNHDLARRADELQRLALLVHSAVDRGDVYAEIVNGAKTLLRTDSAALFVVNAAGTVELLAGDAIGSATMAARVARLLALRAAKQRSHVDGGSLIVPLPTGDGERLGALVVWDDEAREYVEEEVALAEAFAAFGGTALANSARLELERSLVAQLQQTLDLRRSLVMSLSHELRTPLTCVVGFAETLIGNWDRLDERARYDCVVAIRENATELGALVEHLLDFGSLETGRLVATMGTVDLQVEVDAALRVLAPVLAERTVTADIEPVKVVADPVLLRRTLSHLLTNAAKYAGPGVPVSVRATVDGKVVRVEVADEGRGMTAAEAARVFEPFWRSTGAQLDATRGSGIGLALVREYVRLMGGDVSVRSSPGAGATFAFTLPRLLPD